jgi:hypothetical protein
VKEAVRLAIGGPPEIGARASAALTDLMASSGVLVSRTGSVVLEWPNARLPLDPHAWTSERSAEADPLAFATRHLEAVSAEAWVAPVDQVRTRVADWLRDERLRLTPPWPGGATCAVALVHAARPFPAARRGLRGALARGPREAGIDAYARLAEIERAHGATSALTGVDALAPDEQAQVRALGFALDTPGALRIAPAPGYRRGTAFPTRVGDGVEVPLLDGSAAQGLPGLLAAGGGAALAVPVERFAGEGDDAERYTALLTRLAGAGAWLTTPAELARALYA